MLNIACKAREIFHSTLSLEDQSPNNHTASSFKGPLEELVIISGDSTQRRFSLGFISYDFALSGKNHRTVWLWQFTYADSTFAAFIWQICLSSTISANSFFTVIVMNTPFGSLIMQHLKPASRVKRFSLKKFLPTLQLVPQVTPVWAVQSTDIKITMVAEKFTQVYLRVQIRKATYPQTRSCVFTEAIDFRWANICRDLYVLISEH